MATKQAAAAIFIAMAGIALASAGQASADPSVVRDGKTEVSGGSGSWIELDGTSSSDTAATTRTSGPHVTASPQTVTGL